MNEIQELRKRLAISQDKLARRLGVAVQTIRRWESGKSKPSSMAKQLIKELFGAEIE